MGLGSQEGHGPHPDPGMGGCPWTITYGTFPVVTRGIGSVDIPPSLLSQPAVSLMQRSWEGEDWGGGLGSLGGVLGVWGHFGWGALSGWRISLLCRVVVRLVLWHVPQLPCSQTFGGGGRGRAACIPSSCRTGLVPFHLLPPSLGQSPQY